ncbi:MAG: hypothetical protein NWE92_08930 [Candidatus Bathyarchaeota archaeon]|nr:hypothetical protein [Candidatus Bathyarchaeota archaeon]
MPKKLLLEISLIQESENTPNNQIIKEISEDIKTGRCIIPWCSSELKIIQVAE